MKERTRGINVHADRESDNAVVPENNPGSLGDSRSTREQGLEFLVTLVTEAPWTYQAWAIMSSN
jgi:hypothetical protein